MTSSLLKKSAAARRSGMTLIELTVVILVLLSLISVLFIGATAWKRGSDRASAILLIRNSQVGMRAVTQIEEVEDDNHPGMAEAVFGQDKFVANGIDPITGNPKALGELPNHPANGLSFDFVAGDSDIVPPLGTLYICTGGSAGLSDPSYNPIAGAYESW